MKKMTWIVIANSAEAHIYECKAGEHTLIKTLSHPASLLKSSELATGQAGKYQTSHAAHGQFESPSNPHEQEHQHFAKEIADYLEQGRNQHLYQNVILCAEPHFYGLLKKSCNPQVNALVSKSVQKDISVTNPALFRHDNLCREF